MWLGWSLESHQCFWSCPISTSMSTKGNYWANIAWERRENTAYMYIYMYMYMGRESSHGIKQILNLPPLVLKAWHLKWLCVLLGFSLPEQAMGWLPLRFGIGSRRWTYWVFIIHVPVGDSHKKPTSPVYMYICVHVRAKHSKLCIAYIDWRIFAPKINVYVCT